MRIGTKYRSIGTEHENEMKLELFSLFTILCFGLIVGY